MKCVGVSFTTITSSISDWNSFLTNLTPPIDDPFRLAGVEDSTGDWTKLDSVLSKLSEKSRYISYVGF